MNTLELLQLLLTILLPIVGGVLFIYAFTERMKKEEHILKNGISVEGTIFDFVEENSNSRDGADRYPLIRFVTQEGEWITERYHYFSSAMQLGDAVKVTYDPKNPQEFYAHFGNGTILLNVLAILTGIGAIGFGIYKLVVYLIG